MEKGICIKGQIIMYKFYDSDEWVLHIDDREYMKKMLKGGYNFGGMLNNKGFWYSLGVKGLIINNK